MSFFVIILVVFLTSLLLAGDYLIKYSTGSDNTITYLIWAAILWVISIPGWYYVVKDNRIAVTGMLFAILSMIGTTLIGVFLFHEKLSMYEYLGLGFGIVAAVLLSGKI